MSRRKSRAGRGHAERQPPPAHARRDVSWGSTLTRLRSALDRRPDVSPVGLKTEWPHLVVVFVGLFALYTGSAPRTVTLEDDGLFIMASYFLGIDHPPGYPVYTLLGKLFTLLPVGSIAFRVHLLSAFFGALTAVALWLVVRSLLGHAVTAYTGALLYGVSATFWSQAIIAETYAFNTFLFFSIVYLVLTFLARQQRRLLYVAAALFGLSLANHWPLMLLSSPCFLLLLLPARREVLRASLGMLGIAIVTAVAPYVWMVVRSRMDPEISFYGPLPNLDSVVFFISRRGFRNVDVSQAADLSDKLHYLGFLLSEMVRQFTPLGAVLAGYGLVWQWRRWNLATCLGLVAGGLGSSLVLWAMLGFDYEPLMQSVIRRYPLIAYGVLSIWLVLGLEAVMSHARRGTRTLRIAASVALVAVVFLSHRAANVRKDDTWARDYATAVLQSLERDAILFVHGDDDAFPIGYVHEVEGVRPDVTLYNDEGLVFRNRLFRFDAPDKASRLSAFVRDSHRPIYYTAGSSAHEFSVEDGGLYEKVRKDVPGRVWVFALGETSRAFLDRMERTSLSDPWALHQRDGLRRRFMGVLAYFKYYEPQLFLAKGFSADYERLAGTSHGSLGRLTFAVLEKADPSEFFSWVDDATRRLERTGSKSERAWPPYMKGTLQLRLKQDAEALASLDEALRIYPSHKNPAALALLEYHSAHGNPTAFLDVGNRIFVGQSLDRPTTDRLLQLGARLGL
jgi:transmembrane protein TMEM260 (protein O-mannosyltransferase)